MQTRQEAADALLDCGLDARSMCALLEAMQAVITTGWGTVTIVMKCGQVETWEAKFTGKVER